MAARKARARQTLQSAIGKTALRKIGKKTTRQFVNQLREQGVSSLEDLASALITTARAGAAGRVAFDPEDFPICYKFTTYRPIFNQAVLAGIVARIDRQLLR
jgi:hypothetical protein